MHDSECMSMHNTDDKRQSLETVVTNKSRYASVCCANIETITGRRAPNASRSRSSLVILLQLKFELLEYEMDRYDNVSFSGPLVLLVMTVQWY